MTVGYFINEEKSESYQQLMYLGQITVMMKGICSLVVCLQFARGTLCFQRTKTQGQRAKKVKCCRSGVEFIEFSKTEILSKEEH